LRRISLNRMRNQVCRYRPLSLGAVAFQACLIDRSSISPFRINHLQSQPNSENANCDRPLNRAITYGRARSAKAAIKYKRYTAAGTFDPAVTRSPSTHSRQSPTYS
jgi:hypothetical protein